MNYTEDKKPADLLRHYQTEFGVTAAEAAELYRTLEQCLREIRQLLADGLHAGDREKMGRAGHSLKGLAAQDGLNSLSGLGAVLEAVADPEYCQSARDTDLASRAGIDLKEATAAGYHAVAQEVLRCLEQWLASAASAPH